MPISPELGRPPVDLDESKLAKLENKTNNSEVPENTIEEDTEYISKYVEKRIEDFDAIQAKIDQGEDLNPEELKMIY